MARKKKVGFAQAAEKGRTKNPAKSTNAKR